MYETSHQSSSDNQDDLSASSVSKDQSEVEHEKGNGVKPSKTRKTRFNINDIVYIKPIHM
jgi:hypothetical protein